MTTIAITSVSRTVCDSAGGQLLEIVGDFLNEFGKEYQIHIGSNGDYTDLACFSGIPGRPRILYPTSNTKLRGYIPPLIVGGPYHIYVRRVDMTRDVLISSALTASKPMFFSSVFALRTLLPLYYATGPRNIELAGKV
jgi:hypothetical protein